VTNGDVERIEVPSGLLRPLALHVREHPERSRRVRVTLVREAIVSLAPERCPPILAEIRRVTSAPLLVDAISSYTRAADKAARALGLAHRRELLARDDGPLPLKYDVEDIVALAKLEPALLTEWATAAAVLHVALERSANAASLRAVVAGLTPLAPFATWLVPSLLRWAHLRIYELLFGPFEGRHGALFTMQDRVPPEWEAAAVTQTPGPPRSLFDKAIPTEGDAAVLAYKVKAWWGVRVEHDTVRDVAARWHATMTGKRHVEQSALDSATLQTCGCLQTVKKGITEVSRLLLFPD
jgi:hypothetical protein